MSRHGVSIFGRNPRTGTIHYCSVDEQLGAAYERGAVADGMPLPREAHPRLVCCSFIAGLELVGDYEIVRQPAPGARICAR
jgi:hypothetical protein